MQRRHFLATVSTAALALKAQSPAHSRFRQSAMMVNFPNTSFEDACAAAAGVGCKGFDLVDPKDWPTLKKNGLICSLYHNNANTFKDGIIHPEVHAQQEKLVHADIDLAAATGYPNVILVGGERQGMKTEEGSDHAVAFLNRIKAHAEDKNVNIVMEPVNPIDRPDQILSKLAITADICKRVHSPRVKILFDIYHVQQIDGDVSNNLRKYFPLIGHIILQESPVATRSTRRRS
jgi:hydroxypyruvate isomerase